MRQPFPAAICRAFSTLLAGTTIVLAACSDDATAPEVPSNGTITVDASATTAYLTFGSQAATVSIADPTTSAAWDMSLFATGISLNGGAAGPGGVVGYCLCANAAATDAAVMGFTSANELAAFEAVTTTDIPASSAFTGDVLVPAISGWYSGTPGSGSVVSTKSFVIRKGSTAFIFAKLRVTGVTGATASYPGDVTFEYAIQPSEGAAMGSVQTKTVTVGASPVLFGLTAGTTVTGATWDIKFDGYDIRTNGSVSGSGSVKALGTTSTAFGSIDATYAQSIPASVYGSDRFGGVFATSAWYRYNLTGSDNQIWPTFNVYLIKRGSTVYKVQLTGYYNTSGTPRFITIRYARLVS